MNFQMLQKMICKTMPVIAKHGLPLLVHCELTDSQQTAQQDQPASLTNNYLLSRPPKWEDDAIALMIRLCEEYQLPGTYCSFVFIRIQ